MQGACIKQRGCRRCESEIRQHRIKFNGPRGRVIFLYRHAHRDTHPEILGSFDASSVNVEQIPIIDGLKAKVGEQRVSTAVQCRRKPVPIELSQFWRKAFRFNPLFEILCKAGLIKVDE